MEIKRVTAGAQLHGIAAPPYYFRRAFSAAWPHPRPKPAGHFSGLLKSNGSGSTFTLTGVGLGSALPRAGIAPGPE